MTRTVLIYTDPGIDDAFAIALAAGCPDIEIAGITTVAGNATLDKTTDNALKVCALLGLDDVPVIAGSARPLLRELVTAGEVHGESGLGRTTLPAPERRPDPGFAPDFIVETITNAPGEVSLVAIGPLTNVALALRRDPSIIRKVRDFVIMGGAATVPGNLTPAAEFNIGVDPEAAAAVFACPWTTVMIGLDATRRSTPGPDAVSRLRDYGPLSDELLLPCLDYYTPRSATNGDGPVIHDACAVAYAVRPDLFDCRPAHVAVETAGRLTSGMTVTDFNAPEARRNSTVALDVDARRLWDLIDGAYRCVHTAPVTRR